MGPRWAFALLLFWPIASFGQVSGRFYLEKETYALGEPVFLYFETTNSGTQTQNVYSADPYAFCSGYSIKVSPDFPKKLGPDILAGSCLSSDRSIEPGKAVTERILLNFEHKVDSPGAYEIEAEKSLSFAPGGEDFYQTSKNNAQVRAHFHFTVDGDAAWQPAAAKAWVEELRSNDYEKRSDAARTLASVAPASLESILLTFADHRDLREWAPLALYRLNTPTSLAAMARILETAQPGTYEHMKAADYLAETGDAKWFPVLLQTAKQNPRIAGYVDDAAEVGKEQVFPMLFDMLQSSDTESARPIAVTAFGYTGSRAAIPTLLGLLKSDEPGTAQRALYGLRLLTHRDIGGDHWFDNPQSQYQAWLKWWNSEGATARIYSANDSGETKPLQ